MQRLLGKLTYSNVVSSLCLVLVLGGGTAFAASKLGKNSVGTKQLQSEAVTGAKIKDGAVNGQKVEDGSLTGADVKVSSLGTVPTADFARTATNANSAQTAGSAKTADSATTAQTADSARTAGSATTAERANIASSATSATTAGSAVSAQTAKSAETAKTAETAAKATVAETLNGHTAFSFFTPEGEREVTKVGPFTIKVECEVLGNGEQIASITVASEEGESELAFANESESLQAGQEAEVFTQEYQGQPPYARVARDVTAIAPSGAGFTLSGPTIGFNLGLAHEGQCFFSGVIQQLTPLS